MNIMLGDISTTKLSSLIDPAFIFQYYLSGDGKTQAPSGLTSKLPNETYILVCKVDSLELIYILIVCKLIGK